MEYLNKVHKAGVINIEMESLSFAALTHHAGIKSAVICVTLVDRLKGDQVRTPTAILLSSLFGLPSFKSFRRRTHTRQGYSSKTVGFETVTFYRIVLEGCTGVTQITMQEWPKMQQWPVWCGVKNTFGMLVHSKEYAFPVLSVNSRIVLPNKEWDLLGRAPVSRSNNYNVFLMSVLPPPPLGSVLSQINLFHTFKLFVSKIDFNIIPPFVPNFPSGNFLKFCGPVVVLFFFKYCTIALVDGRVSLTYFQ